MSPTRGAVPLYGGGGAASASSAAGGGEGLLPGVTAGSLDGVTNGLHAPFGTGATAPVTAADQKRPADAATAVVTKGAGVHHRTSAEASGAPAAMRDIVRLHNLYRVRHGVKPLIWSSDLASSAADWVQGCPSEVPDESSSVFGENLGLGYRTFIDAVQAWYAEVRPGLRGDQYQLILDGRLSGRVVPFTWQYYITVCESHGAS